MTDLLFNGLDMLGENEHEGSLFEYETQGDDLTWGNPQPINVTLTSMLQDGALVYTQGYDNREVYLRVTVAATDPIGLQAGEDALAQSCGKATTLEWTPPGFSPTTVFKVLTATIEHIFDDLDELRYVRTYGLRVVAAPFTRSAERVTLSAEPAANPYSETVIDEATSTTGWTASGTLTSEGSGQAVRTTDSHFPTDSFELWLERSGGFTVSAATPYIRFKGATSFTMYEARGEGYVLTVDGVDYEPVASLGNLHWFAVPAGTYSTVRITANRVGYPPGPGRPVTAWTLTLWSLYQTSDPGLGSRRSLASRFSDISGSVRAPGDVVVSHDSNGLGDVLLYVYPTDLGDYAPPLDLHRTGGGAITAEPTNVSGGREPLTGTPTWTIPAAALPPGGYHFLVRLRHTSAAGTYSVTYTAAVAGTTISRTVKVTLAASNTWQIVTLGTEHLPPLQLQDGSTRDVVVTLTSAEANLQLDTGWLFLADEVDVRTALVQVAAGAGKSVTYRIADVDFPTDMVFIDDYAAGLNVGAAETPQIVPPEVNVYLVTTGTEDAEAELSFYPHWFTHAGV